MNISDLAITFARARHEGVMQSAETVMAKKAMDMQKVEGANTLALIQSASPTNAGLPDHIGQNLNVT